MAYSKKYFDGLQAADKAAYSLRSAIVRLSSGHKIRTRDFEEKLIRLQQERSFSEDKVRSLAGFYLFLFLGHTTICGTLKDRVASVVSWFRENQPENVASNQMAVSILLALNNLEAIEKYQRAVDAGEPCNVTALYPDRGAVGELLLSKSPEVDLLRLFIVHHPWLLGTRFNYRREDGCWY